MRIAIITGASSGVGARFARELDKREDIEEFWLIARRKERLSKLCGELATPSLILPYDLCDLTSFDEIGAFLEAEKPEVGILVNSSGSCHIGDYESISISDEASMIDLNCRALVLMTKLALPYMKRGGRIIEIGSTAGFQPFPYLNVYAASKAFVYRYSRALNFELRKSGIKVTVVCPYWIKDTELIGKARKGEGSGAIKGFPLASREKSVVGIALFCSRLGLPVSTPGIICTIHRFFGQILPSSVMMRIWNLIRKI